jgi:hypothetical protein
MTMPTTEGNARSLAAAKGYTLHVQRDGSIVARADGVQHVALTWSAMLRFLVAAPRLDGGSAA